MRIILMNSLNVELTELYVEQKYEEFKNRNKSEPFLFSGERREIEINDVSFSRYSKTLDTLYIYIK